MPGRAANGRARRSRDARGRRGCDGGAALGPAARGHMVVFGEQGRAEAAALAQVGLDDAHVAEQAVLDLFEHGDDVGRRR